MKTIASGIKNLTDARYFSAMNVDWIGYDMRPGSGLSIEHLIAFSEWVEGPAFLVDVRGRTESEIGEILADFEAAALVLDEQTTLGNYSGDIIRMSEDRGHCNTLIAKLETIGAIDQGHGTDLWVIVQRPEDVAVAIDNGASGLVITGGEEQEVGMKDYESIDAVFQAITD